MKFILIAVAISLVSAANDNKYNEKYIGKYEEKNEKYTDKYDLLDLDTVLQNKRLFMAYCKCVLDIGKCTPEAKELKSHIAEALQNGCAKCTHSQRHGMRKVIKHVITKEPEIWQKMIEKYDPKRIYVTKYEKELKSL